MSGRRGRLRPAGGRPGDGEIETTGVEKLLAVVLAVFIAIGAVWTYVKLDDVAREDSTAHYLPDRKLIDREELAAIERHRRAIRSVQSFRSDRRAAIRALEISREAYRTALDADQPAAELQARYEAAQARLASVSRGLTAAAAAEARARPEAADARERLSEQRAEAAKLANDDRVRHDRIVFVLRLALLTLMLAGAYLLLSRLRTRRSRYLPAALAWIGATAVLAIVMAGDYTDSYIEFDEVGPLAISIVGIGLTLIAFAALQRFLARRIPARRVRRGECPFCGFPVREKPHCEGCGRVVFAECSSCQQDRRVGTARCGFCGNP